MGSHELDNKKILADLIQKLEAQSRATTTGQALREVMIGTLACISRLKINAKQKGGPTFRELLSLTLLVVGNSSGQCSDLMGISVRTVQEHERNTRRKLNAKNRANAFYLAQLKNYITLVEI